MGRKTLPSVLISTHPDGSGAKEYESVREAAEKTGINRKSIRDAATGAQKSAGGLLWRFIGEESSFEAKPGRKVYQLTDSGEVIRGFNSIIEAARAVGVNPKSIRAAATGKQKHAAGFVWSYEKNSPKQSRCYP